MPVNRDLRRLVLLLSLVVLGGALTLPASAAGAVPAVSTTSVAEVQSLVRVATPTRADKERLNALGLDLTEHATDQFIEVVLHRAADATALREAGLDYVVQVADLGAQNRANRDLDAAYAASVEASPLPSGRTSYRSLAQYEKELAELTAANPGLVKALTLSEVTIEGRKVNGIEITQDVDAADGKPVFLLMGLHHVREWPSGEHALEFAYDLVNGMKSGDPRTVDLLSRARVIIVPVVNPDGYHASFTSGAVDGRSVDNGGIVAILATPGNAYRRKNCRPADGVNSIPKDSCITQPGQGGFGTGVDPNRNYGGLWGGVGASATPDNPTYRGANPFSEPETRNIRALVSARQVTTLISNHTFSNLVLRPPGVRAQGLPPDETVYEALGARMAQHNGYVNQPSYQLYDTTGTTEDWSYPATGGLGFTFEIGEEFHPPFERVVAHYVGGGDGKSRGAGPFVDKGNREAYFEALASTADTALHSTISGSAPAGAVLTLEKEFVTKTSEVLSPTGAAGPRRDFTDKLSSSMTVGQNGAFTWHTNPSTRPAVMSRRLEVRGDPIRTQKFNGGPTTPGVGHTDHEVVVTEPEVKVMQVDLTWPTPDDMDLEVYRKEADGKLTKVASSGAFVNSNEQAFVENVTPNTYVLRQINFASVSPSYTMTATLYGAPKFEVTEGLVESYTLVCTVDALEKRRQQVVVERGSGQKVDACGTGTTGGQGAPDPLPKARDILRACPDDRVPRGTRQDTAGNTHERAIDCMIWYEIAKGFDDKRYGPFVPVSREQMASFVARLVERSGGSFPAGARDAFTDDNGSTHEASINKLAAAGIVKGTGGTSYDPRGVVSRDQMATFLVNGYEFRSNRTITPRGDYFDDDAGNTHEAAINRSAEVGFTGGQVGGNYAPRGTVLRDQMASFLARVLDLHVTQGTTQVKQ
jgi:hypothetical protein